MEKVRLLGIILAIACAGSIAHAGDQVEEAKAHFKSGAELYDENNFRGALVEFQRAYDLAPSYRILFNIGQVQMELQDYAGALKAYSRYLREGGPDLPPDRVAEVTKEIERLKGRVGSLTVQTVAGAEILIDEMAAGFAPLPEPVPVNAGRHQVTVHVTGRDPVSRIVDVAGQQQLTVALANDFAIKDASALGTPPKPSGPPSKVPMIVSWSAAGGCAIVASIFALSARSNANDLATLRNSYPVTKAQLDAQASKTRTASLYADGLGVATVIAAGFGLYFTLTLAHGSDSEKTVQVHVGPTGAYVAGHF
jgi:PEGA domain